MASYLRPRRGKEATAKSQNIVLKRGEIFFETPSGGVGTGIGRLKMGDGSTSYSSLPYFLQQLNLSDNNTKCAFTNVTSATDKSNNSTYLNNIAPTNNLKTLFQNIKQLLLNYNNQLTSLNNDLDIVCYQQQTQTIITTKTWATADNTPEWIVPENGLYYLSAYFSGFDGTTHIDTFKFQIIIPDSLTELGLFGQNSSPSFCGSASVALVNAIVPLNKGTRIQFSVWTANNGQKIGIKQWHVLLKRNVTDKSIVPF